MNKVGIVQVRTSSTRLPNKCLLKVYGRSILEHILNRLKMSKQLDEICVATTIDRSDDIIEILAGRLNVSVYRGSVNDVLDRFYHAAESLHADVICRVTADDPFKDPRIMDTFIDDLLKGDYDYVSNTIEPSYPEGIDIEIFRFSALERAWKEAKLPSEREHVTPYIWKNKDIFKLYNERYEKDLSGYRWTLDKAEDWVFIQQVYDRLYTEGKLFYMEDILRLLSEEPWLADINKGTVRNEGYLRSIAGELDALSKADR